MLGGQRLQRTVGLAVELHEHEVPDLDYQVMALIDQGDAVNFGALFVAAKVDVDLAAGAAGAGVSHFPEIVMLVAEDDVTLGQIFEPLLPCLFVHRHSVTLAAFEDCGVETVLVELENFGEKFPSPLYRFLLEVVAETPVAEHLEHGVVVGVVTYFLQVVVLTAHAKAFLRICDAVVLGGLVAEEPVLELVHSCVGEHQGRVILHNHRGGRNYRVAFRSEEVQKGLSYLI